MVDAYEELLVLSMVGRHVRTVGGSEYFHLPIGAIITPEIYEAAKAAHMAASQADWIADGKENWAAGRAPEWKGGWKHLPPHGALGSYNDAMKSAAAYAANPTATKFKNLPSHHPFNLPVGHPKHVAAPPSVADAMVADHLHHVTGGNTAEQFAPHPSNLSGPNKFSILDTQFSAPKGSRIYTPKGMDNVRLLITPDEQVFAFTDKGQVDVPLDLQHDFASVLPPNFDGNELYAKSKWDVQAPLSEAEQKALHDTHATKQAARDAHAIEQQSIANSLAPLPATPEEAGKHAVTTGALIHAHPGAELVDHNGDTQFVKQGDNTWKHALFGAVVDESVVQKLVKSGELQIKQEKPALQHDFSSMSPQQWQVFLDQAPVGASFQVEKQAIIKGQDGTWNGIPSSKMGIIRLIAKDYNDGGVPGADASAAKDSPTVSESTPEVKKNLDVLAQSELGDKAVQAYQAALKAEPSLAKTQIKFFNSTSPTPGYASMEQGKSPQVQVNKAGSNSVESSAKTIFSIPGARELFAAQLGISPEQMTPEILGQQVILHELGHALEYQHGNLSDIAKRDKEAFAKLPIPNVPTSKLMNPSSPERKALEKAIAEGDTSKTGGATTVDEAIKKQFAAYRQMPGEKAGDEFAAKIMKENGLVPSSGTNTGSVDGTPKESNDGSAAGPDSGSAVSPNAAAGNALGANGPGSGNPQPAGPLDVPAHDGGNGQPLAGGTGSGDGAVAGPGNPGGAGSGPGVVPAELIKSDLPHSDAVKALQAKGLVTPEVVELHADTGAQYFSDAISALKENNPYASSVYVYPVNEYKDMRLFVTPDGSAGFAVHDDVAVSVFINPKGPNKGGSVALITMATENGAKRLDAFDTVLPAIYAKAGYVPVARVHWDDEYAPEGWDKSLYGKYNNGEPDVVFMVHDPEHADGTYTAGAGKVFDSYDNADSFAEKAASDPNLLHEAHGPVKTAEPSAPQAPKEATKPSGPTTKPAYQLAKGDKIATGVVHHVNEYGAGKNKIFVHYTDHKGNLKKVEWNKHTKIGYEAPAKDEPKAPRPESKTPSMPDATLEPEGRFKEPKALKPGDVVTPEHLKKLDEFHQVKIKSLGSPFHGDVYSVLHDKQGNPHYHLAEPGLIHPKPPTSESGPETMPKSIAEAYAKNGAFTYHGKPDHADAGIAFRSAKLKGHSDEEAMQFAHSEIQNSPDKKFSPIPSGDKLVFGHALTTDHYINGEKISKLFKTGEGPNTVRVHTRSEDKKSFHEFRFPKNAPIGVSDSAAKTTAPKEPRPEPGMVSGAPAAKLEPEARFKAGSKPTLQPLHQTIGGPDVSKLNDLGFKGPEKEKQFHPGEVLSHEDLKNLPEGHTVKHVPSDSLYTSKGDGTYHSHNTGVTGDVSLMKSGADEGKIAYHKGPKQALDGFEKQQEVKQEAAKTGAEEVKQAAEKAPEATGSGDKGGSTEPPAAATSSAGNEGPLWEGAPNFSKKDLQEAHDALENKGGFQIAYAFKDVPNNPLASHQAELKEAALKEYPGLKPKDAVVRFLKDHLGIAQAPVAEDNGPKLKIGNADSPKAGVQGFDGGEFSKKDIQGAIDALKASPSKLSKSILNNAHNPLGKLDPNKIVGFNKDKTVVKKNFIDHLQNLLDGAKSAEEAPGAPEEPKAAPKAPQVRPEKATPGMIKPSPTTLEPESRFKPLPFKEPGREASDNKISFETMQGLGEGKHVFLQPTLKSPKIEMVRKGNLWKRADGKPSMGLPHNTMMNVAKAGKVFAVKGSAEDAAPKAEEAAAAEAAPTVQLPAEGEALKTEHLPLIPIGGHIGSSQSSEVDYEKIGPNEFKNSATENVYPESSFQPFVAAGNAVWKGVSEPAKEPATPETHEANLDHEAEVQQANLSFTPVTLDQMHAAAVGSIMRLHSLTSDAKYDLTLESDGKWHNDQLGVWLPGDLENIVKEGKSLEMVKQNVKTAPTGDPHSLEDLKSLPNMAQLTLQFGSNVYDVQKMENGNFNVVGLGIRTPENMKSFAQDGELHLEHLPKPDATPLSKEDLNKLGNGSTVFYNGGYGRVVTKEPGSGDWITKGGQDVTPESLAKAAELGKVFLVQEAHLDAPNVSDNSPAVWSAPPNSLVEYPGDLVYKKGETYWHGHQTDGTYAGSLTNAEVAKDVANGTAEVTFTPSAEHPLPAGKYVSNGTAAMHVLEDGSGIYVAGTGTVSKISAAKVMQNHDAGMSNYLGATHPVPQVPEKAPAAPKAAKSPSPVKKAASVMPTSKDLPDGVYHLKSVTGPVILIHDGGKVSKDGEEVGGLEKLKLAFNKGQILDPHGSSIVPDGYAGGVVFLNSPTTIPGLLDAQKWLEQHTLDAYNSWPQLQSGLSSAGLHVGVSDYLKKFNQLHPDDKIYPNYWGLNDATVPQKQALHDFLYEEVSNMLNKVDTTPPEVNTAGLFEWTTNGEAKMPLEIASIPQVNYAYDPKLLTAYVKQIAEALGAQKIFNVTHMDKYDKATWINDIKAGNFEHAYKLEVAAHAQKNKSHPSGYLHPGYEGNAATNHVQWTAAVEGEVAAGVPIDGNWSSSSNLASVEELNNYLIAAHMQHPEWLTTAQKRQWVGAHKLGDKPTTDQLSAGAALKKQQGEPQVSETPVWTDNVQPAKSYDVWFDNGPYPTSGQMHAGGTDSYREYLTAFKSDPEVLKSYESWHDFYAKNLYASTESLVNAPWYQLRDFLDHHFTRLREEAAIEAAKPKYHVHAEIAQGEHPTYHVKDQNGNDYVFKPVDPGKEYRAEIEAAAVQLGALFGFSEPHTEVGVFPTEDGGQLLNGQPGLLQAFIANKGSFNQPEGHVDMASLTPQQLGQVAAEHVLDWAIDNDDAHSDNLLFNTTGSIVGIDKGRAFVAFGHWDGLSPQGMNSWSQTVASKLYSAIKSGKLSQEQVDGAYLAALKAATKISKVSETAATSILGAGLEHRPHYNQGPKSKDAVIKAFLDRKHGIVDDIQGLWDKLYKDAGLEKPQPPAKALGEEHMSGWHEADLSPKIEEKKVWGLAAIHASPDIKQGQSLIWTEKASNGDTVTKGMFKVNYFAENKILSWLDGHLSSDTSGYGGTTAVTLTDFPNLEALRKKMSTAGKEVSSNIESGVFDQNVMDEYKSAKEEILKDIEFSNSLPADSVTKDGKILFPSGREVNANALGQYRAALSHYLDAANEVQAAIDEKRSTIKSMFGLYTPIAPAASPKMYIHPEKGLSYTELSSGSFISNKGVVTPASQLPDEAAKGLDGWSSINVSNTPQSSGFTVVKEHAGDTSGSLLGEGIKKQNDSFSQDGHTGAEYVVHLGTGEYIRFRNSSHTSTLTSQHDAFRFRLAGSDREASLARVEALLSQMGIDMSGAQEEHTQDNYWREMFYRVVNSHGGTPKEQAARDKLLGMRPALAQELGVPNAGWGDAIDPNHLIDALAASKTVVPDQHEFWHDLAVETFGQNRVDEFLAAGEHMPQYQHFDIANPDVTTGHAFFNRIDFTLKDIYAKKTLIGQGTKGKDKSLANFIKSGNAISTEERLRLLGAFGHGISKGEDQEKGGANSVFTRVAYGSAKYEGSAGFGQHVIYWNPAVTLQTGTMTFPSDSYGALDAQQTSVPLDIMKGLKHNDEGNEADVANAISVLDYMEIMIFENAENRNKAIQAFKTLGIDTLRGVPIEDRLIMRDYLDQAMATVMNAWGKN